MFVIGVSETYLGEVFWIWIMGGVREYVWWVDKCFKRWGGGLGWRELATFRIPIRFLDLNLSPTLNLLKNNVH